MLFVVLGLGVYAGGPSAQPFPHKVVKLIVGHGAGGQSDTIARIVAPKLAEHWKQPVVIENRIGAAGMIAASHVAHAPTDGYTLLLCSSSNLAIAASVVKIAFDPMREFAMIGRIATIPTVLAVSSKIPAASVAELVEYARTRPGQLTAGSSGNGSSSGFLLEMLKSAAGVDILQVPYNGLAPAVIGLIGGQIDMVFADRSLIGQHAKTGTVRVIAAAGSTRLLAAPELPTLQEQGLDGVSIDSSIGLVAPSGTPSEIVTKIADDLESILRQPEVRRQLMELGFDPIDDTPAQFTRTLRDDIRRFSAVAARMRAN
jgi:tripartite-type tricarboxylate transporter receptor subunit TctC